MGIQRPSYAVEVERRAGKAIRGLQTKHRDQVLRHIQALADDPRPPAAAKLALLEGYRLTSGAYRVLYTVDDAARLVRVYRVFKRGDGYSDQ